MGSSLPEMGSTRSTLIAAVLAALLCVTAISIAVARSDDPSPGTAAPAPTSPAPRPEPTEASYVEPGTAGVVTTDGPTSVRAQPSNDSPVLSLLRGGITLPVTGTQEGFLAVMTPCEVTGWVATADVTVHPRATGSPPSIRGATILIDPGHGGRLPGAVGPTGLTEKEANADIVRRLAERLEGARVFLTLDGDHTAGLVYRTALADSLGAHVFVSVHNNADPDGTLDRPGTETYFQFRSPHSRRLAGLLYEEVVRAVEPFGADWVGDRDAGAKYRLNTEEADYYGILRRAEVPTVLVEALYISNASEEALLRRDDAKDAIAEALAEGLRRFFSTDDPGSGFTEPYPRPPGPSGRLPSECVDPAP